MQDLIIRAEIFQKANLNPKEILIDIAVFLYEKRKLTMGQAKRMAGLDQISFQKEMMKRGVYMNYGVEEFEEDMKTLGLKP